MSAQLLSLLMRGVPVAAALFPLTVCVLAWTTAPFAGRAWIAAFLVAVVCERTWAMFLQHRDRFSTRVHSDWTAVAVGYAYAATLYATAVDTLVIRRALPHPAVLAAGLGGYGAALALRYWAMAHLRHQWTVHVDRDAGARSLITTGPYGWVRHPLYTAACLETLAVPLALLSWPGLALAAFAFVPCEVLRARFEERFLRLTFGPAYDAYASRTGAFLPTWRG